MAWWELIVQTKHGEHSINVGQDESQAVKRLDEAKRYIGMTGTVTIAERLALEAQDILSVRIEEKSLGV